ncbi:glucosamine-6-phosphate deaminase [Ileibacterium valens]|uniref:glucosamine-6-phosphate deaminase n=1 Tax=Ileibacterium valens TaxID=1862668 RepID=UPI00272CF450|nr:glucosamine-6-phosphate deaminase [Ileibacterium valens]
MKVFIEKDYDALSDKAFEVMKEVLDENDHPVLGLATGSSPEGLYARMVEDYKEGNHSYKDVVTFNLDEYVGIDRNDPQSYYTFMNNHLFKHIDIDPANTHVPYGSTDEAAKEYDDQIKNVSIQLLGIGRNGHIGFSEPGTPFDERTHIVDLTDSTIEANKRFFDNDVNKVPKQAISQGIATIMDADKILLIASGADKADAVKAMIEGEPTIECPASALQNHKDVVVVLDEAAASKLTR